jgi:dipeptidyl-peptidase-3
MASISPEATAKLHEILHLMVATQPSRLGYPDETSQSNFYPGKERITKQEIEAITNMIEEKGISAENTRLQKQPPGEFDDVDIFYVLQASAEEDPAPQLIGEITIGNQRQARIFLCRGDHSKEMEKICSELVEARKYASTAEQRTELSHLVECFRTGEYKTAFWAALKEWVKDKNPRVEHSLGWLSSYRDPHNARTDWQSSVGITDVEEVKKLQQLLERTKEIIRTLPWAKPDVNDGISLFERTDVGVPDFAIIHGK